MASDFNDVSALQGVWVIVKALESGKESTQGPARLEIRGNTFKRRTDTYDFERRIAVDVSQSPAWIDLHILNEPGKGKTLLGVFYVEKDELRICHAKPGAKRPSVFSSTEENEFVLSISHREKAE